MRVISRKRLRQFWENCKKDGALAERDLSAWYKSARRASWSNFAELKQTFGSADRVGNCVVFDPGNNRWRLVACVIFKTHCVYVLKVMDHSEYDKKRWVKECGCDKPPPRRTPTKPIPRKK